MLFLIVPAGLSLSSCSNDLDPQSPEFTRWPVVYSVLELHRDTLSVRVTRTFTGTASAMESAQAEDSLYFPQARVWLERWNGKFLAGRAELSRVNLDARNEGKFMRSPNWIYILVRAPETEILFTGSINDQEYHLSIEIPEMPLVFSSTRAYPPARMLRPNPTIKNNLFLNPLDFTWVTPAPFSELWFRFYYTDVYAGNEIQRSISWREYHNLEPDRGGTESIFGQDFMRRIAGQMRPDRMVLYRHITGFQAVVAGIPEDLHDYRLMLQVQPPDQIGFPVTNITNGIGLFTSQTITAFELQLDDKSKDSIMFGQHTKQFNFRFY
jgi:hypothetical protein